MRGSSPLTWGILPEGFRKLLPFRIIPAYGGNTDSQFPANRVHRDHPYLRGEYVCDTTTTDDAKGSSPPTWGIQAGGVLIALMLRIIPTYVGNTSFWLLCWNLVQDHPHLRGEYWRACRTSGHSWGSSPPTWGIPYLSRVLGNKKRIIPTYVGNTKFKSCSIW